MQLNRLKEYHFHAEIHIRFHFYFLETNITTDAEHKWNLNNLYLGFSLRQAQDFKHTWALKNSSIGSKVKLMELLSTSYHLLCSFWSYLETLLGAVTGLEGATKSLGLWKCHPQTRTHIRVAESHTGSFSEWALRFSLKTVTPSAWGQDQTLPLHLRSGSHCLLGALGAYERKEGEREKKEIGNTIVKGHKTKLTLIHLLFLWF